MAGAKESFVTYYVKTRLRRVLDMTSEKSLRLLHGAWGIRRGDKSHLGF
jgi:hypothetical protein